MAMTPGAWIQVKTNNRPIEWDTYLGLMRALGHAAAANGWDKAKKKAARAELTRLLRAAGYNLARFPYEQVVVSGDYVLTNQDKPPKHGPAAQTATPAAPAGGTRISLNRFGTWFLRPAHGSQTVLYNAKGETADLFGRVFDRAGKQIRRIDLNEVAEIWSQVLRAYNSVSGWNETLQKWFKKFPRITLPRIELAEVPLAGTLLKAKTTYENLRDFVKDINREAPPTIRHDQDIPDDLSVRYATQSRLRRYLPRLGQTAVDLAEDWGGETGY